MLVRGHAEEESPQPEVCNTKRWLRQLWTSLPVTSAGGHPWGLGRVPWEAWLWGGGVRSKQPEPRIPGHPSAAGRGRGCGAERGSPHDRPLVLGLTSEPVNYLTRLYLICPN